MQQDQEHEDSELDQHLKHDLDDGSFALMDNDLHLSVEQRKEHPHLTSMCSIYFDENVRAIEQTSSMSM